MKNQTVSLMARVILLTVLLLLPIQTAFASTNQDPVPMDAGHKDAYRVNIAFDNAGNAMAVFEQKTGDAFRVYANQYIKGMGWRKPVIIDANNGNAYRAKVAFDKEGNAISVFKQGNETKFNIYASMYIKGMGWQKPVVVDNGTGLVDGQEIVFDDSGNAAAVFEEQNKGVSGIYVNMYIQDRGWQGPVRIDRGKTNAYFPTPVFDSRGNLFVVYYKEDPSSGLDVYASRYDTGKRKWDRPVRITNGPRNIKNKDQEKKMREVWTLDRRALIELYNPLLGNDMKSKIYSGIRPYTDFKAPSKLDARYRDAYTPALVAGKNGDVAAFFVRWDGEHLRGYTAAYSPDKWWQKERRIDSEDGYDTEHIKAAINAKGEMAVVFGQWTKKGLRVHARIYWHERGWGEAKIIDAAGEEPSYNPSVVLTDDSEVISVWCQWEKHAVASFANIYKEGSGWDRAKRLNKDDAETCGVRIARGPDGSVITIFEQGGKDSPSRLFAVGLGRPSGN